jgi:hypothetical protein
LLLVKLINKKYFSVKEKFNLILEKYFPKKFKREKFRNIILFADYIKFDLQTFDYYIFFILNIYFLISFFKIYILY